MAEKPLDALVMKQLIAVIDRRTTVVCLHAAGQIQPVGEPFNTLNGSLDSPPFHYGCRSFVVPWMPGGINDIRDQANAELLRRPLAQRRLGPGGDIGGRLARIPPKPTPTPRLTDLATEKELIKAFGRELSEAERRALDHYIGPFYQRFNRILRKYDGDIEKFLAAEGDDIILKLTGDDLKALAALIERFVLPRNTVVYRGMRVWEGFPPKGSAVGYQMRDPSFMSTSFNRAHSLTFATEGGAKGGVMLEIDIPAGTKAMPIGRVVPSKNEAELLLQKGTRLVVTKDEIRTVVVDGREVQIRWLTVVARQ